MIPTWMQTCKPSQFSSLFKDTAWISSPWLIRASSGGCLWVSGTFNQVHWSGHAAMRLKNACGSFCALVIWFFRVVRCVGLFHLEHLKLKRIVFTTSQTGWNVGVWGRPAAKVVWHCAWKTKHTSFKKKSPNREQTTWLSRAVSAARASTWTWLCKHPPTVLLFLIKKVSLPISRLRNSAFSLRCPPPCLGDEGREDEEDEEGWRASNGRRWLDGAVQGRGVLNSYRQSGEHSMLPIGRHGLWTFKRYGMFKKDSSLKVMLQIRLEASDYCFYALFVMK